MRLHFISRLTLLLVAGFLVVATQVWLGTTLEWLFIAGGVVMIALAAAGLRGTGSPQRALDAAWPSSAPGASSKLWCSTAPTSSGSRSRPRPSARPSPSSAS